MNGVMANLSSSSLNLSVQSLDLLRWTLCKQQQQQQQNQHLLESGKIPSEAHISSFIRLLLGQQMNSLQVQTMSSPVSSCSFMPPPQSYQTSADSIPSEHHVTKFVINHMLKPMSSLDASLDYYSSGFWQTSGDQRANSLPFMSGGPWKLLYATMIYLCLVTILIPRAMRKLPALELNWPLRGYNLLMIVSNIYAFYHGCRLLDFGRDCFGCEVINHQDYSHAGMELLNYGWLFLLSRLVEWLDTIFFVLRKKDNQVTKLHLFHHSFVPLICWTYLKYHPGKTVAFFPLVNTFVHSIMYTYYFLSTFGPAIQPYLWWKKYLTSLQIAQFVLILIQLTTIPLSTNERCKYPRGFLYVAFAGAILFLWLFYTYYIETYKMAEKSKRQAGATKRNFACEEQEIVSRVKACKSRPSSDREGASKSLWDSIENAISLESSNSSRKSD